MKFSLSWLKDHIDTQASAEAIGDKLTAIGLEVESVSNPAAALAPFVVAKVLTAEKHPQAEAREYPATASRAPARGAPTFHIRAAGWEM